MFKRERGRGMGEMRNQEVGRANQNEEDISKLLKNLLSGNTIKSMSRYPTWLISLMTG